MRSASLDGYPVYQAYANVTSLVQGSGGGTWQAQAPQGGPDESADSGWTLVVVADDPSAPVGQAVVVNGAHAVTPASPSFNVPLGDLFPAGVVAGVQTVTWSGYGTGQPALTATRQTLTTNPSVQVSSGAQSFLVGVVAATTAADSTQDGPPPSAGPGVGVGVGVGVRVGVGAGRDGRGLDVGVGVGGDGRGVGVGVYVGADRRGVRAGVGLDGLGVGRDGRGIGVGGDGRGVGVGVYVGADGRGVGLGAYLGWNGGDPGLNTYLGRPDDNGCGLLGYRAAAGTDHAKSRTGRAAGRGPGNAGGSRGKPAGGSPGGSAGSRHNGPGHARTRITARPESSAPAPGKAPALRAVQDRPVTWPGRRRHGPARPRCPGRCRPTGGTRQANLARSPDASQVPASSGMSGAHIGSSV